MQFLTSLFGGADNMWLTAALALGVVVVLILLLSWLLRVITGKNGEVRRGRHRRLVIMESLMLDQKRQLMIVRRDQVEHLILVGGPTDLLVEAGIPVEEQAAARAARRVPLPSRAADAQPGAKATTLPISPAGISPGGRLGEPSTDARHLPRHPGLADPPFTDNSGPGVTDSAKEAESGRRSEQAEFEDSDAHAQAEPRRGRI